MINVMFLFSKVKLTPLLQDRTFILAFRRNSLPKIMHNPWDRDFVTSPWPVQQPFHVSSLLTEP